MRLPLRLRDQEGVLAEVDRASKRRSLQSGSPTWLLVWTNLRSKRCGGGETLASSGNPVAQLARDVLERDFCLLERAGTRVRLSDTAEMDDEHELRMSQRRVDLLPQGAGNAPKP